MELVGFGLLFGFACAVMGALRHSLRGRKDKRRQTNPTKERECSWLWVDLSWIWLNGINEINEMKTKQRINTSTNKRQPNELREAASKANQLQLSSPAARDEELELFCVGFGAARTGQLSCVEFQRKAANSFSIHQFSQPSNQLSLRWISTQWRDWFALAELNELLNEYYNSK